MFRKLITSAVALMFAAGISYAAVFTMNVDRIAPSANSVPVVSACGTGTLAAGSSDLAGTFTATGATGCTLTFGTAYVAAPSCSVTELTVNTAARTTALSTTALVVALGTSGSTYSYVCFAKAGG